MKRIWSKDETILALYLYYQIPFGKIHSTNSEIIKLANLIGRTPSAVCMKMCNLARFDKTLANRKVNGLKNGSKMDEYIWTEFEGRIGTLVAESNKILNYYLSDSEVVYEESIDNYIPKGNDINIMSRGRHGQDFFRRAVLSAYNYKCCITNVSIPELLIASHIKPWKDSNNDTEKLNPRNGLCLNAFFDKAFDTGLITLSQQYRIIISKRVKNECTNESDQYYFLKYEGKQINLPEKFKPDITYIEYHNDMIFKG